MLRLEHARGRALRLGQTWEIVTWEIAHLESCRFGKGLWESTKPSISPEFFMLFLNNYLKTKLFLKSLQKSYLLFSFLRFDYLNGIIR